MSCPCLAIRMLQTNWFITSCKSSLRFSQQEFRLPRALFPSQKGFPLSYIYKPHYRANQSKTPPHLGQNQCHLHLAYKDSHRIQLTELQTCERFANQKLSPSETDSCSATHDKLVKACALLPWLASYLTSDGVTRDGDMREELLMIALEWAWSLMSDWGRSWLKRACTTRDRSTQRTVGRQLRQPWVQPWMQPTRPGEDAS
jgi:hypothetical protein